MADLKQVNDFYASTLRFLGMTVDTTEGTIRRGNAATDQLYNFTVGDKMVIMPTETNIRQADGSKTTFYHPLDETSGENALLRELVGAGNIGINYQYYTVMLQLLTLAENKGRKSSLSPDALPLMGILKDVDATMVENFRKLSLERFASAPEKVYLRVILKRGKSINGVTYSRGTMVVAHMNHEIDSGELNTKIKLRERDRETFKAMFDYVWPMTDGPDTYCVGSNSDIAPYLESYMRTMYKLGDRLMTIASMFEEYVTTIDGLFVDTAFLQDLERMPELKKAIRSYISGQDQNTAIPTVQQVAPAAAVGKLPTSLPVAPAAPIPTQPPSRAPLAALPAHIPPVQQTSAIPMVPPPPSTKGSISVDSLFRTNPVPVMNNGPQGYAGGYNQYYAPPPPQNTPMNGNAAWYQNQARQNQVQNYQNGGYPNNGYPGVGYPNNGYPNNGYPNGGYPNNGYPNGGYMPGGAMG